MIVFVINKHGESLMPCKPSKARKLIKKEKAKIIAYKPFTIQLLYGSRGYKQDINLGIDLGSKNIGVAITTNDKVRLFGKIGFISGFTNSGCYIKDIDGNYITIPDKNYKQVSYKCLDFLCHNNNWQFIFHL